MRGWVALAVASWLIASPALATAATPEPVRTTAADEINPSATDGYIVWAQNTPGNRGHFDTYAKPLIGQRFRVNAPGTQGFGGGIDGPSLVYQQVDHGRSDLELFDLATHTRSDPPAGVNTKLYEWSPTISGDLLLFNRDDTTTDRSPRRVILHNLATGAETTLFTDVGAKLTVQAGQVNGNYATYSACSPKTCNVFRYDIAAGTTTKVSDPGKLQYGPSVGPDGTLYYARSGQGCGSSVKIVRFALDGTTSVLVALDHGLDTTATYVFTDAVGTSTVYYNLGDCKSATGAFDIYRAVDA